MRFLKYLLLVWLCVVSAEAQAILHRSMYAADLPANVGQTSAELTGKAWQALLPRLTGRSMDQLPAKVAQVRARTLSGLVDRYSYRMVDEQRQFHVVFSMSRVNALLTTYHVSLWGRDRPPTLLWVMSVSPDGSVSLLTADTPVIQQVSSLAHDRAYPLVLPIGDLSDAAPLKSMAAAMSSQTLQSLAKRYHVHRLLVVRLKEHAASEWVWWTDEGRQKQWQQPYQAAQARVLSQGLGLAIGFESERSHVQAKHVTRRYPFIVLGVESFADSEHVLRDLSQQHAFFQWQQEGLDNDGMHVTLISAYSLPALRRQLRRVKGLSSLFHGHERNKLIYVWGDVSPEKRRAWGDAYAHLNEPERKALVPMSATLDSHDDASERVGSYAYQSEVGYEPSSKAPEHPVSVIPAPSKNTLEPLPEKEESHD